VQPSTPCKIQTVLLWMKAFIPKNAEGSQLIPDGIHKGKTMLGTPGPIQAWFLTDERDFSSVLDAQSRMHSEIKIDFTNLQIVHQFHNCDATVQVHHDTGEELCRETASTDAMSFSEMDIHAETGAINLHLKGSTKNACLKIIGVKISPNLDYEVDIQLRLSNKKQELELSIDGMVEVYPAFEIYISINDGEAVPLLQLPVEGEPIDLIGSPKRPVNVSTTIACQAG
jgi:hypothetical protein